LRDLEGGAMSSTDVVLVKKKNSLAKGVVAGLIGGLIGVAAKTLAERMFPPHSEPEPQRPGVAAYDLTPAVRAAASIPWGYGATVGAAYGALAEYYPAATAKQGASFGLALGSLTQEGALPAFGLAAAPEDQTMRGRTSEMTSHVVYGVVTEVVRSLVRKLL